jgi:hypothetical protein
VKLNELKKPLHEGRASDDVENRAKKEFTTKVIGQLNSLIPQAIQMGVVDPNLPAAQATPAQATPAQATPAQATPAQATPAQTPNVANQAAQTRQQKQATAAQTAQTQMAQNAKVPANVANQAAQTRQQKQATAAQTAQTQMAQNAKVPANAFPETPEQKRKRLQQAATQTARASMTPKSPAPQFKGPNIKGLQVRNMGEGKKFDKLNRLFESIIDVNEATSPMSISDFIQSKIDSITKSKIFTTSPYKEEVKKITDTIQSSYAQDKGDVGIQALADYAWGALMNTRKSKNSLGSGATAIPNAADYSWLTGVKPNANGSTAAPEAEPEASTENPVAQQQSKVGVRQINKIIPTLRKRDLLSVKKNVDNTLNGRGGGTISAAPVDTGASAFGQMANTLSGANTSKSSTGGTTTKTPTGRVHTAKPQAAATAPEKDNIISMPKRKTGKVRASREGGVTPEEQAKFDEKVRQAMANQK